MTPGTGGMMQISYRLADQMTAELARAIQDVPEHRVHYFGPCTEALERNA